MSRFAITEAEVEDIIMANKSIVEPTIWDLSGDYPRCKLNVSCDKFRNLNMRLNMNNIIHKKFSFSLLYKNAFRIRGLDVNSSHENKHTNKDKWIREIHKHKWSDVCANRFAYTPSDITMDRFKDCFLLFCKECNIDFQGKFIMPPAAQTTIV